MGGIGQSFLEKTSRIYEVQSEKLKVKSENLKGKAQDAESLLPISFVPTKLRRLCKSALIRV